MCYHFQDPGHTVCILCFFYKLITNIINNRLYDNDRTDTSQAVLPQLKNSTEHTATLITDKNWQ